MTMRLDIKPRAAVVNNTCSVSFLLHPPLLEPRTLCHGHPALPAHSDLCQMASFRRRSLFFGRKRGPQD